MRKYQEELTNGEVLILQFHLSLFELISRLENMKDEPGKKALIESLEMGKLSIVLKEKNGRKHHK